jgi:hypothetical protein
MQVVSWILLAVIALGSGANSRQLVQQRATSTLECIHTFHGALLDEEQGIGSALVHVEEECCLQREERVIGCRSSLREVLHLPKLYAEEMRKTSAWSVTGAVEVLESR